jgi:hypothetical protein
MTFAPIERAQRATCAATAEAAPEHATCTRSTPGAPLRRRSSRSANPATAGAAAEGGVDAGGVELAYTIGRDKEVALKTVKPS